MMKMDRERHVEYWQTSSREDLDAARDLLERKHVRHGLFFLHLSVEKLLKGLIVGKTGELPPRSHDLLRLAELAGLNPTSEQSGWLARLNRHCLEGRYPDTWVSPPDDAEAKKTLEKSIKGIEWLKRQSESG